MAAPPDALARSVETDLPARLDRLPWSRFHLRVVLALGVTWILDGLEVTIVGSVAAVLVEPRTLGLGEPQIGLAASAYLAGAMIGALFFGRLTDRYGRKKLFLVTLGVYLAATLATALAWDFYSFALFRALTGCGIGGECSAMNSAIDELLPARLRGRVDLGINATYWLGTALGSAASLVFLDERLLPHALGWRLAFGLGGVLGFGVLLVRRHVPESPRWLIQHGRQAEAARTVATIEAEVERETGAALSPVERTVRVPVRGHVGLLHVARVLFTTHRRRSILVLSLMVAQAFAYNAIFFTYALVLGRFYGVPAGRVGLYLLPFAAGNLLGPLVLGHLFDSLGRRAMIVSTYGGSSLLLFLAAFLFLAGKLDATTHTLLFSAVFFVASAAASSAYLSVSELFPVELRGLAIAVFYVAGLLVGGVVAPSILATLIHTGRRAGVCGGYCAGAALLAVGAIVAAFLAVPAERKSLEEIAELGASTSPS